MDNNNNSIWMKTHILDKGYDPMIYNLNIPGSHNSALTYESVNINNSIMSNFRKFDTYAPYIPFIFKSWIVCQNKTIYEQLEMGVRYFDFRISYTLNDFYITHSYQGPKLNNILDEIYNYYNKYGTSEIIIIKFIPDYENRHTIVGKSDQFTNLLHNHKVYDLLSTKNKPFDKLSSYGSKPIIVINHLSTSIGYNINFNNKWFNNNNQNKLFENIKIYMDNIDNINLNDNISVIQSILTPRTSDIINGILIYIYYLFLLIIIITLLFFNNLPVRIISSLIFIGFSTAMIIIKPSLNINTLSSDIKHEFIELDKSNKYNIVIVDFIDEEFCNYIIKQNKYIL